MTPTHRCPAGHQEKLPYKGDAQSWCDQCGYMVNFTRIIAIPSRIVSMPPERIRRTPEPSAAKFSSWAKHRPYKEND